MSEFTLRCETDAPIIVMQHLDDDSLGIVTASKTVTVFPPDASVPRHQFRIEELSPLEHGSAFSPDGSRFAFAHAVSNGYAVRIIDTATKELIRSYGTQENPVELLAFDAAGTYLLAGTSTGRVFLWRTDGSGLLARLSSFPEYTPHLMRLPRENYVSAAAFQQHLVATTGYGGSIVVTNIRTLANTRRIKPGRARIDTLIFLDERRLLAGNEDGILMLIHTDEHHRTQRIGTGVGPIRHLLLLPDPRFALVASAFNHIALVDVETMELLDNRFITTPEPVRAIALGSDTTVTVATESGHILEAPLSPFTDFADLIDEGRYPEAYALCDRHPFLKSGERYRMLEEAFGLYYTRAQHFLADGRNDDARSLLHPFMKTTSKAKTVQDLFNAFDHYPRLRHLASEQKYSTAYGLCGRFPTLRESPACKGMEAAWHKAYATAQKLALKGLDKEARQSFGNFLTVAEKSPYIRLLLHNKATLVAFAKALQARDYIALKKLTEREPILRDTPSYKEAIRSADTNIEAIMEAVKEGAFEKAELLNAELRRIPHLAHHCDKISRFIEKATKIQRRYDAGDMFAFYEQLDIAPDLAVLPCAKTSEQRWRDIMDRCEAAAQQGDIVTIKSELGPLLMLPTRSDKVGNLLRMAYQVQIKRHLARKDAERAGHAIERYIDLFGIDNETRQLIRLLNSLGEDLFLSDEQQQNRPRSLWLSATKGHLPDTL